jgi:hypothetical protein
MCEYGTLKPMEAILGKGKGKREHNGGQEPNLSTLYTYIEMSQ